MSTVVIIAVGSRGDVATLTGVGVALQRAGHDVAIAAYTPFADMITNSGLGFRDIPAELELAPDGAEVAPIQGLAHLQSAGSFRADPTCRSSAASMIWQPSLSAKPGSRERLSRPP